MNEIKIISVEAKKGYYLVTTSISDYKFDEDTIVKYEVFKDKVFSKKVFDKILNDNEISLNFNKIIKYLSYGPRSKYEIISYLQTKKVECIEPVIKKLMDKHYIDDKLLAINITNYYKEAKKGPNYIKRKLQERRIEEEIITNVLATYSFEEEEKIAFEVASKEASNLTNQPLKKQKTSLYQKLISRGFSYDITSGILERIEYVDNSSEKLVKDYERLVSKYNDKVDETSLRQIIIDKLLAKGYDYKDIKNVIDNNSCKQQ